MVAGRAGSGALRPGAGGGVSAERTRAAGSGEGRTVPIRLMQTHTTCRMLPLAILGTQSTPSGCMRKADRHGPDMAAGSRDDRAVAAMAGGAPVRRRGRGQKGALAWGRISGPTPRIARRGRRTPCRPRSRMRPLCVAPQLRAGDGPGSRRVLSERRSRTFPEVHRRNRQRTKCAGQWAAAAACVGFARVLRARRCKNW